MTKLKTATLKARLDAFPRRAVIGIAMVSGLLVFGIGLTSAADTGCIERPTVECVAEIAAQQARTLDRSAQWEQILGNLAAAGRADVATELANRLPVVSWDSKGFLEAEIIALRIAAEAKSSPSAAEALGVLSALGNDHQQIFRVLNLAARDLAGERPYAGGGSTWLVSAKKAYASNHRAACSATLQTLLQRWSETVGTEASPSLFNVRTNLADAYLLCGDKEAVIRTLDLIDPDELARNKNSLYLTLLARSWIRAGRLDRALAVSTIQPDPKFELRGYLEVARAYVAEGRNDGALTIVSNAFRILNKVTQWPQEMELRANIIDVERQADDRAGALRHTEELALLAERPDPFRPFSLIRVATLFNDLNRPDRAIETLEKAIDRIPPSDRIVGFGHVAGAVRYEKAGLEGEALQLAGIQLCRAGQKVKAIEVIRRADPLNRRRAAIEIVSNQLTKSPADPEAIAEEFGSENPGELLLVAAGRRIELGDTQGAAEYFERFARSPAPYHEHVNIDAVRVAVMLDKPEYLTLALQRGLRGADSISDPNRRVLFLASLAASANARLP